MCIKELPRSRNLELGFFVVTNAWKKQKTFETLMPYIFCNTTYLMFFLIWWTRYFHPRGLKYAVQNSRRKVELTNLMNDMSMAPVAESWWTSSTGVIKGLFWNCWDDQRGTNTLISTCYHCGITLKCVIKKWWTTDLPSWVWCQALDASKDIPKQKCWEATSNKLSNLPSKSGNF